MGGNFGLILHVGCGLVVDFECAFLVMAFWDDVDLMFFWWMLILGFVLVLAELGLLDC